MFETCNFYVLISELFQNKFKKFIKDIAKDIVFILLPGNLKSKLQYKTKNALHFNTLFC